jgi:hypothetical protein
MRILQFPKERWTGGPPYPTMADRNEPDEFDKEIQLTRQNQQLMLMLEKRAEAIASVSLDEIKKRISAT